MYDVHIHIKCIHNHTSLSAQILEKNKYRGKVEKIKTIGSTYMAATGLGEVQVRERMYSTCACGRVSSYCAE